MSTDKPKAVLAKPKAALIVAADPLSNGLLPGEKAVKKRLEDLDYNVDVKEAPADGLDVRDTTLMVVSSSVKDGAFGDKLRDLVVPIIASSKALYVSLGMCGTAEAGEESEQSAIEIIAPPGLGIP